MERAAGTGGACTQPGLVPKVQVRRRGDREGEARKARACHTTDRAHCQVAPRNCCEGFLPFGAATCCIRVGLGGRQAGGTPCTNRGLELQALVLRASGHPASPWPPPCVSWACVVLRGPMWASGTPPPTPAGGAISLLRKPCTLGAPRLSPADASSVLSCATLISVGNVLSS